MAMKLNERGFEHAKALIIDGRFVHDDRDAWSDHQPSAADENRFIEDHGIQEFGRWYLGVDEDAGEDTKGHYKFPYGDFRRVHRCGVISAESRAAQNDYDDITKAVEELHELLDGDHA